MQAEKEFDIRFSEVDSMQIVWHGSYALYFEDAREEFGRKFHLEYMRMYEFGFYAPLVEFKVNYKQALKYQDKAKIVITFRNTESAKLIFDYEIYNPSKELITTAKVTLYFLCAETQKIVRCPDFLASLLKPYWSTTT